ncbi:hypothetical protein MtrunA17_Chr7g0253921 [Medicago truncatula]|uniref:Transmembrane protein n=1 Tax=Medicago truncatula TaxID=3880 RepID=A0A396H729_MEDTR|nr:hypothetical protein MtrunA17_Chr7g0253921 [Medicago truncatula]
MLPSVHWKVSSSTNDNDHIRRENDCNLSHFVITCFTLFFFKYFSLINIKNHGIHIYV